MSPKKANKKPHRLFFIMNVEKHVLFHIKVCHGKCFTESDLIIASGCVISAEKLI